MKKPNYIEGNQGAGVISIFQTLGVSRSSPRSSGQHILGTDCWVFCFGKGRITAQGQIEPDEMGAIVQCFWALRILGVGGVSVCACAYTIYRCF